MERKGSFDLWQEPRLENNICVNCKHHRSHHDHDGCTHSEWDDRRNYRVFCMCDVFEPEPLCECGHGLSAHGYADRDSEFDLCRQCSCYGFERIENG